MDILQLNAVIELAAFVEQTTDNDVIWAARNLREPDPQQDKILGAIESDDTKRLWSASTRLRSLTHLEITQAQLEHDETRQHEREEKAARLAALTEVARNIAWISIRDEIPGAWAQIGGTELKMCAGWQVAEVSRAERTALSLLKRLGLTPPEDE